MRQISRFSLSALCVFILMGVGSCVPRTDSLNPDPWNAESYEDRKVDWCAHTYHIHGDIQFCSMWELTSAQITFVEDQFGYTGHLYRKWAPTQGNYVVPEEITVEPYVYMVPMTLINDKTVFKRKDSWDRIAGRYITHKGWIFVTERVFTDEGYTDLPHEVAHWLNENIGNISGTPKDEQLADAFESYYTKECRGCR